MQRSDTDQRKHNSGYRIAKIGNKQQSSSYTVRLRKTQRKVIDRQTQSITTD